jgi:hypothetical protein
MGVLEVQNRIFLMQNLFKPAQYSFIGINYGKTSTAAPQG